MIPFNQKINILLYSAIILSLLFIDYKRTEVTDKMQKTLFLSVTTFFLLAISCDTISSLIEGRHGLVFYVLALGINTLYYFFQYIGLCFSISFTLYLLFKDPKICKIAWRTAYTLIFIYGAVLLLNLKFGFYFSISEDATYIRGSYVYINYIIMYLSTFFIIIGICMRRKELSLFKFFQLILFITPCILFALVDIINPRGLIWCGYTIALLFSYLFIIRSENLVDNLTGVKNRKSMDEYLQSLVKKNKRKNIAFIMVDIDNFKEVNDTLGHLEGDKVLKDIAAVLSSSIRHTDFLARFGGDEFFITTENVRFLHLIVERIQENMKKLNEEKKYPFELSLSIGYEVKSPETAENVEEFLKHVDNLMYIDKQERKEKTKLNEKRN